MPGRLYTFGGDSTYRYGFNGKENDNSIMGLGNSQDYGNRFYEPRIGRFGSVDFRANDFPGSAPYIYAGDDPIYFTDYNGDGPQPPRDLTLYHRLSTMSNLYFFTKVVINSNNFSMASLEKWGWSNDNNIRRNGDAVVKGLVGEAFFTLMLHEAYLNTYREDETPAGNIDERSPADIPKTIEDVTIQNGLKFLGRQIDVMLSTRNLAKMDISYNEADGSLYHQTYKLNGKPLNFVFEVKTVNENGYFTPGSFMKGMAQAIDNARAAQLQTGATTVPVLVVDRDAFLNAYKSLGSTYESFKAAGGKLILIRNFENDAKDKTEEIRQEIRKGKKP